MTEQAKGAGAAHDATASTEAEVPVRLTLVEEREESVRRLKEKVKKTEAALAAAEKALKEAEKELAAQKKEKS